MKKLVLVDGHSLVFRAYYATAYKKTNLIKNHKGQDINALIVFINMFKKILEQTQNYICVVFDSKKKTERHAIYQDYKKGRTIIPQSLISQIILIKEYLTLSGIKYCEQPGFEADDIIGTIAKQASKHKIPVLIFSSDKDFLQLIDDYITICFIKKGIKNVIYYNHQTLWDEYFLKASQIVDFKSLVGDSSDNIKGIPSIGPKTAMKLLSKFHNLDNIFKNLNLVETKIKEKLIFSKELLLMNRFLTTINNFVPLNFDYTQTEIRNPKNINLLNDFFYQNRF